MDDILFYEIWASNNGTFVAASFGINGQEQIGYSDTLTIEVDGYPNNPVTLTWNSVYAQDRYELNDSAFNQFVRDNENGTVTITSIDYTEGLQPIDIDETSAGSCEYPDGGTCTTQSSYEMQYNGGDGSETFLWEVTGAIIVGDATLQTVTVETTGDTNMSFDLTCTITFDGNTYPTTQTFTHTRSEELDPMVTYWLMNDFTGDAIQDASGNDNDGVLSGTYTTNPADQTIDITGDGEALSNVALDAGSEWVIYKAYNVDASVGTFTATAIHNKGDGTADIYEADESGTFTLQYNAPYTPPANFHLIEDLEIPVADQPISLDDITEDTVGSCEYPAGGDCTASSVHSAVISNETGTVSYTWSVDTGIITDGQGTATVTVETTGNSDTTFNLSCEVSDDNSTDTLSESFTHTRTEASAPVVETVYINFDFSNNATPPDSLVFNTYNNHQDTSIKNLVNSEGTDNGYTCQFSQEFYWHAEDCYPLSGDDSYCLFDSLISDCFTYDDADIPVGTISIVADASYRVTMAGARTEYDSGTALGAIVNGVEHVASVPPDTVPPECLVFDITTGSDGLITIEFTHNGAADEYGILSAIVIERLG